MWHRASEASKVMKKRGAGPPTPRKPLKIRRTAPLTLRKPCNTRGIELLELRNHAKHVGSGFWSTENHAEYVGLPLQLQRERKTQNKWDRASGASKTTNTWNRASSASKTTQNTWNRPSRVSIATQNTWNRDQLPWKPAGETRGIWLLKLQKPRKICLSTNRRQTIPSLRKKEAPYRVILSFHSHQSSQQDLKHKFPDPRIHPHRQSCFTPHLPQLTNQNICQTFGDELIYQSRGPLALSTSIPYLDVGGDAQVHSLTCGMHIHAKASPKAMGGVVKRCPCGSL